MFDSLGSPIMMPWDAPRGMSASGGKCFYVSQLDAHLGSDSNEGTDPQYPLLTLDAALALCTQRRHDYIFCQDIYQDDEAPTIVDIRNVHCIGMSEGNQLGSRAVYDGQGSSCFQLGSTGGSFELAGFRLGSASSYGIEVTSDAWFNHIHHNAFGHFLASTTGIYCPAAYHTQSWMIDHNFFSDDITSHSIDIGNVAWTHINHNVFHHSGSGSCIYIRAGSNSGPTILGNCFSTLAAGNEAIGWGIYLIGCSSGMIMGNYASECGTNAGDGPYLDLSTADQDTLTNAWAGNVVGNAYANPGDSDDD